MTVKEKVTLTLPQDLMEAVRTIAPARGQSQFIAEAIEYFIKEQQRQALRERLIAGYQANADRDASLAAEWEPLEAEAWSKYVPPYEEEESANDTPDPKR
jgi:metal-responsive CopG/Arc/MetJ family transcriptional regulator